MLDALLNIAADSVVHLEVRTDNDTAIALYRSVGFTEVGLRRRGAQRDRLPPGRG